MDGGASFDSTGAYRYRLWREWDRSQPAVAFVMLNPSTADAERDDPTIRRCISFARNWGFGRLVVVNLCAYRARTPRALFDADEPVGRDNGLCINAATQDVRLVVAAWGNHGGKLAMPDFVSPLHHLGLTRQGQPRHPLYLPGFTRPTVWTDRTTDNQHPKTS